MNPPKTQSARTSLRSTLLTALLFTVLLSGCDRLPIGTPPAAVPPAATQGPAEPAQETAVPPEPIRLAEITFRVTIPEDTPSDGPIQLSIMDEVTGLALNAENHTMQAESVNIYAVTVRLPANAIIKYRYIRSSQILAAEHISDGRPVRYRLLHTTASGTVHDIVTRWNDTTYAGPTGRVNGKITDAQTGQPIPDLLVTAGGHQTVTRWDGSYLIEGLPPGTHNLVTYAKNGAYTTFQQGAIVAAEASTPASFALAPAPNITVSFIVDVPENTIPAAPIRIAGNLFQLGNTFSDLGGGISTPAARLPQMTYNPDGYYVLSLELPAGAYVRYKYTLGDGFWNMETSEEGGVRLREFIVPEQDTVVNDTIASWSSRGNFGSVWFSVTTPAETPPSDTLWVQLNPWGWTEPLPMWKVGAQEWVYLLSAPLHLVGQVDFRYCRNAQCDTAVDADSTLPRSFVPGETFQPFEETLVRWISFAPYAGATLAAPQDSITPRTADFETGFALTGAYHPSWLPLAPQIFSRVQEDGAGMVVVSPTWSYTWVAPPVFEPVNGRDMTWLELETFASTDHRNGIALTLFPQPRFPASAEAWWDEAPRDYAWWVNWFEQYGYFLRHHAALAQELQAETLVIGGRWLNPALPDGFMPDGFTSGVPGDAEEWWRRLINEVRAVYSGRLAWALTLPQGVQNPPPFLDAFDAVYVQWEQPLASEPDAGLGAMRSAAETALDNRLLPFMLRYDMTLLIEFSFPAADGGATGCIDGVGGACEPLGSRDLEEQLLAYEAVMQAVNARDWIDGVIAAGYYPPVALKDKSSSVHGKPAEELLRAWFTGWKETGP